MMRYRNNEARKVVQETLKGYGKGFNLLVLVSKGIKSDFHPLVFVGILIIRGSASSLYKTTALSVMLNKPLALKKPK
jgi:hypothetical protein